MNLINEFIREIVFDRKLTVKQMSDMTNFSENRIEEIILKDITPTVRETDLLLDGLGVDFMEMIR